jgi:hypothetical protein
MQNFTIIYFLFLFTLISSQSPSLLKDRTFEKNGKTGWMDTIDSTGLELHFELSYNETSKHPNSETTKIQILDRKVQLSKKYQGSRAHKDEHFEKKLNDMTEKKLIDFLNTNHFYINYQEIKDIKGIGISGHLAIEIKSPYNSIIQIDGKTNMWGSDDYVRKEWGEKFVESRTNIEKVNYFIWANQFIAMIKSL